MRWALPTGGAGGRQHGEHRPRLSNGFAFFARKVDVHGASAVRYIERLIAGVILLVFTAAASVTSC